MKKFCISLLFFGSFSMAMAQAGGINGQNQLNPYALWTASRQYAQYAMPVATVVAPAPMSAFNAISDVVRAITQYPKYVPPKGTCHFAGEVDYCNKGNTGKKGDCSPLTPICMGTSYKSSNLCRPSKKIPCVEEPFRVSYFIGDTPMCPASRISLDFKITGGTKNYTISIDNRIISQNNIGFLSTEKNTSQAVRVFISDKSTPQQTWSRTIIMPACRNISICSLFTSDFTCSAAQCQWEYPECAISATGVSQCGSGVCRDPDPYSIVEDALPPLLPGQCRTETASINCKPDEKCDMPCSPLARRSDFGKCVSANTVIPVCQVRCLSSTSVIATPIGDRAVTELKVGDIVWTTDAAGNRVVRSLIKVSRVPAPNHRVVHLVLADGRSLDVSALHPAVGGMTVGDLAVGDVYDGSTVQSAALKAYEGTATYDILPAGDTGYYFANGILMGSTLK